MPRCAAVCRGRSLGRSPACSWPAGRCSPGGGWRAGPLLEWAILLARFAVRAQRGRAVLASQAGAVVVPLALRRHRAGGRVPLRRPPRPRARVEAFFSLSGGSGRTTLAVEVAALVASRGAAARASGGRGARVALLDLATRSPAVALRLGLPVPSPAAAGYPRPEATPALVTHASGLAVHPGGGRATALRGRGGGGAERAGGRGRARRRRSHPGRHRLRPGPAVRGRAAPVRPRPRHPDGVGHGRARRLPQHRGAALARPARPPRLRGQPVCRADPAGRGDERPRRRRGRGGAPERRLRHGGEPSSSCRARRPRTCRCGDRPPGGARRAGARRRLRHPAARWGAHAG